ncbi:hypothetical protein R5H32_15535 [Defluviimonas sp. D31]|uniref:hypothetical protein n=1 Tax=Defluviimonas sp. D31 TaxID=3083253 RepID=UPI00296F661D|nr:hypothetical protein [Defluviimonas sp. D31]MDW4550772.1 hypothetical protein [Defluviimonas sp. D31]
MLRNLMIAGAMLIACGTAAEARRSSGSAGGEALTFIAETDLSPEEGKPLSLCRLDQQHGVFYIPLISYAKAYVLAENRCDTDEYRNLNEGGLALMQEMGVVPRDIPAEPTVGWRGNLINAVVTALLAILLFVGWRKKRSAAQAPRPQSAKPPVEPDRPQHASPLDALMARLGSAVVTAGAADVKRVELLESICSKVQGGRVGMNGALAIVARAKGDLSEAEIAGLGRRLSGDQRELVLSAAALLSSENGRLLPESAGFVERLWRGLSIPQAKAQRIIAEAV